MQGASARAGPGSYPPGQGSLLGRPPPPGTSLTPSLTVVTFLSPANPSALVPWDTSGTAPHPPALAAGSSPVPPRPKPQPYWYKNPLLNRSSWKPSWSSPSASSRAPAETQIAFAQKSAVMAPACALSPDLRAQSRQTAAPTRPGQHLRALISVQVPGPCPSLSGSEPLGKGRESGF